MKSKIILFFVVCVSCHLKAQTLSNQVVASGGNYSTASWGSLSATVGEAVITTLPSASLTLLQGFQQPASSSVGITSANSKVIAANAYPNPALNQVFLEVTLPSTSIITYRVFDMNGKEIITGNFKADALHTTIQKLDTDQLSSGMYLIAMFSDEQSIQNIKIQINH